MLYRYLGLPRTIAGIADNHPAHENTWRNLNDGYNACKGGAGKCCAALDKNPGTLGFTVLQPQQGDCLSGKHAQLVVDYLAAQRPVVAAVHWTEGLSHQHWVVIVGVKDSKLLVLDPVGGSDPVTLADGAHGKYVLDTLLLPQFTHEIGDMTLVGEDGQELDAKDATPAVLSGGDAVFRTQPDTGADAGAAPAPKGQPEGGCAASAAAPGGRRTGSFALLLLGITALLVFGRRQRGGCGIA